MFLEARIGRTLDIEHVFDRLKSDENGLSTAEAAARSAVVGRNVVTSHRVRILTLVARQVDNPLFALLALAASVSFFVGQKTDAVIIGVILGISIGLGFINEYQAQRASEGLHAQLRQRTAVRRDGMWTECELSDVVPGDVVTLQMGKIVPADVRLLVATDLECDESILTGESTAAPKVGLTTGDSGWCWMGTIVHRGSGVGIVCATGAHTEFGIIAAGVSTTEETTGFQIGLKGYSMFLARIAAALTSLIFVINLVLGRPVMDAVLFSLAIAVGITPQLLPAVVTTTLATGARRLARRHVLVKRLVCLEDMGEIDILLTDKTGTLTEGAVAFSHATGFSSFSPEDVMTAGLLCGNTEIDARGHVTSGDPLDVALRRSATTAHVDVGPYTRQSMIPFDHDRRVMSVLVDGPDGRQLIVKGAPEAVFERCTSIDHSAHATLAERFRAGARVIAVGRRSHIDSTITTDDERDLELVGLLEFVDPPKTSARHALTRLADLGIAVKVATGDNGDVARHVCTQLGLPVTGVLSGSDIDELDDDHLSSSLGSTTIFARINPEQKARIVRLHRQVGNEVAFLGDGVNDAIALHKADVGVSVDSATDVAHDAADIILLEKDLNVLADGVVEGRRTFANSIKYVLMGTSSNFGNMFSAAAASAFLPYLPLLPSQILLNNLLYDVGQLAIPSDHVDSDQLSRPSHWDLHLIRRFMTIFGPISSLFDFLTFAVMLHVFDADADLFRAGWFIESLATQSLVIFIIRTKKVPFFRSRASVWLTMSTLGVVAVAMYLPLSFLGATLGFARPPATFYVALILMLCAYLGIVEFVKLKFFGAITDASSQVPHRHTRHRHRHRRIHRRVARLPRADR